MSVLKNPLAGKIKEISILTVRKGCERLVLLLHIVSRRSPK